MKNIKYLLLAIVLVFYSTNTIAENECEELSDLAKTIMKYRQNNGDIVPLMKIIRSKGTEKEQEYYVEIVKSAYIVPLYSTEKYKEEKIKVFKNKIYMLCIQN